MEHFWFFFFFYAFFKINKNQIPMSIFTKKCFKIIWIIKLYKRQQLVVVMKTLSKCKKKKKSKFGYFCLRAHWNTIQTQTQQNRQSMEITLGVATSRRASGGHRRQGDMALPHSRLAEHQRRRSEQNTREIGGVEVCLFCVCLLFKFD